MDENERTSWIESKPKRAIIAVAAIVIGLIMIALPAFSCTSAAPAGDSSTINTSSILHTKEPSDSPEGERGNEAPAPDAAIEGGESGNGTKTVQADDGQDPPQGSCQDSAIPASTSQATSSGNAAPSNDPAPAQPQKRWVKDTERIWVVDRNEWSESVPVHGTAEVSVCNVCGQISREAPLPTARLT